MGTRTVYKPETPGQAATWERIKGQYLTTGLCHRCAAQAAYGHAHGVSAIERPCRDCLPIIGTFELDAPNQWRKASRDRLRGAPTPSLALVRKVPPPSADDHIGAAF